MHSRIQQIFLIPLNCLPSVLFFLHEMVMYEVDICKNIFSLRLLSASERNDQLPPLLIHPNRALCVCLGVVETTDLFNTTSMNSWPQSLYHFIVIFFVSIYIISRATTWSTCENRPSNLSLRIINDRGKTNNRGNKKNSKIENWHKREGKKGKHLI